MDTNLHERKTARRRLLAAAPHRREARKLYRIRNRERIRSYNRQYRERNLDKVRMWQRRWWHRQPKPELAKLNRDYRRRRKLREPDYCKQFYARHREKILARQKGFYARHREKILARSKAYNKKYRQRDKEKRNLRHLAWLARNPNYRKNYYNRNRDKLLAYQTVFRRKYTITQRRDWGNAPSKNLRDSYIITLLGLKGKNVPPALVELTRQQIRLRRAIKGKEKQQCTLAKSN